jgi:hypothetical protein
LRLGRGRTGSVLLLPDLLDSDWLLEDILEAVDGLGEECVRFVGTGEDPSGGTSHRKSLAHSSCCKGETEVAAYPGSVLLFEWRLEREDEVRVVFVYSLPGARPPQEKSLY